MPPRPQLSEKTWFVKDNKTSPRDKNSLLSDHLALKWNALKIVSIKRVEIGVTGWKVTYRT